MHVSHFSNVRLCVTLSTVACQAPLSMIFSPGKNTGVGCCALLHGVFLTQGSNPGLMSLALAGRFFTTSTTWEAPQSSLIFYLFPWRIPCAKRYMAVISFVYLPLTLHSLTARLVKNPPAMLETWVRSLGWEDSLQKGRTTDSSILAREINGLYSPRGQKESGMTEWLSLTTVPMV